MKNTLTICCVYCRHKVEIGNCRYSPYCAVNFRCSNFQPKEGLTSRDINWIYDHSQNK